jgi:FkbM family methyltransferase
MRDYAYYANASRKTRFLNALRRVFQWGPLERVLRHLVSGNPPTALAARFIPPEYLYPKGSWRTIERHGIRYQLDISNTPDHTTYFNLTDAGDKRLLGELKADHVVVDIGANIGIRAMAFARAVPQGRVIAFEPHPVSHRRLLEHLGMNAMTNVTPVNMGVGSERSSAKLYEVLENNPGMNRILGDVEGRERFAATEIQLTPLQPVLEELGVAHVDAIKIDVEGFELEVLRGCAPILDRDHPLLFIELDDDNLRENGSSAQELLAFLRNKGYTILRADTGHPIPGELEHCHFDILCS